MELTAVCEGGAATLSGLDLAGLMDRCTGVSGALDPTKNTVALVMGIIFAVLTALVVLIHRLVNKKEWWVVLLESLEAVLLGGVAGYAGAAGGVVIAELAPPWLLGALFAVLALLGFVFAIVAAVRGNAAAGWKAFGFLHFLVLIGGLATLAVFGFLVPTSGRAAAEYKTYLLAMSVGLGVLSGLQAFYVAALRGVFYVVGAVFLVINGTWGFIGNILGLMTHFASLYSYRDFGRLHEPSSRIFFVCYSDGMSLKSNSAGQPFAFTEGATMTAASSTLRWHEGVHVVQHYLFGPIYVISHFVWFIVMIIPGLIGAAAKKLSAGEGITRMSYYNNPWEVMAYGFMNPSGRNTSDDLIWGWAPAGVVAVLYILAATGVAALLFYLRLS